MSEILVKLQEATKPSRPQRRIPLPVVSDVLYASPNPDGSRKTCANCWKWCRDNRCLEVDGEIRGNQVCGAHVYGSPQQSWFENGVELSPPELVGLIETPDGDGVSCDRCLWSYAAHGDLWCEAVTDSMTKKDAMVHPYGCCARWRSRQGG